MINHDIFISSKEIKYIRSSTYGKMAMYLSASQTPTELQKIITPEKIKPFMNNQSGSVPQVMLNCVNGERLPNKKSQKEVNNHFPELKPWIDMPIWEILQKNIRKQEDFEKLLFKIKNGPILKCILSNDNIYGLHIKTKRLTKTIKHLMFEGSFDALSALTLLLAKAESIKKNTYNKNLKEAITLVLLRISLKYFQQEKFQVIYNLFCKRFSYLWFTRHNEYMTLSIISKVENSREIWELLNPNFNYLWYSIYVVYYFARLLGLAKNNVQQSEIIYAFTKLPQKEIFEKYNYNTRVNTDYYENVFSFIMQHFKISEEQQESYRKKLLNP